MVDVFKDFPVVIESAGGTGRGSFTPDEFRASMGCGKMCFLADCIEKWNKGQERHGCEDRARLEMRVTPNRLRRR